MVRRVGGGALIDNFSVLFKYAESDYQEQFY